MNSRLQRRAVRLRGQRGATTRRAVTPAPTTRVETPRRGVYASASPRMSPPHTSAAAASHDAKRAVTTPLPQFAPQFGRGVGGHGSIVPAGGEGGAGLRPSRSPMHRNNPPAPPRNVHGSHAAEKSRGTRIPRERIAIISHHPTPASHHPTHRHHRRPIPRIIPPSPNPSLESPPPPSHPANLQHQLHLQLGREHGGGAEAEAGLLVAAQRRAVVRLHREPQASQVHGARQLHR
jgi:hypothetical protein